MMKPTERFEDVQLWKDLQNLASNLAEAGWEMRAPLVLGVVMAIFAIALIGG